MLPIYTETNSCFCNARTFHLKNSNFGFHENPWSANSSMEAPVQWSLMNGEVLWLVCVVVWLISCGVTWIKKNHNGKLKNASVFFYSLVSKWDYRSKIIYICFFPLPVKQLIKLCWTIVILIGSMVVSKLRSLGCIWRLLTSQHWEECCPNKDQISQKNFELHAWFTTLFCSGITVLGDRAFTNVNAGIIYRLDLSKFTAVNIRRNWTHPISSAVYSI